MSNLLEQALIDAKALKEAAVKSAENDLLEKYADELRAATTRLLEQEEAEITEEQGMAMGGIEMAPPAHLAGDGEASHEAEVAAEVAAKFANAIVVHSYTLSTRAP